MPRHSLFAPLAILGVGFAILVMIISAPMAPSTASPRQDDSYPNEEETTATAIQQTALASTSESYVDPGDTSTATATTSSSSSGTVASATPTTRVSEENANTVTPVTATTMATTGLTSTATATTEAIQTASPTVTLTPTEGVAYTCVPGESIVIQTKGTPQSGYLVSFGDRVVGGGSVDATGAISYTLRIGDEAPGVYPVVVADRGSGRVLRQLSCTVPTAHQTPVPTRFP